jgi:hypothetical protein
MTFILRQRSKLSALVRGTSQKKSEDLLVRSIEAHVHCNHKVRRLAALHRAETGLVYAIAYGLAQQFWQPVLLSEVAHLQMLHSLVCC